MALVELHAHALIWIAPEETPQDDHQRDHRHAGHDVESVGSEESGRRNFEEDEKREQDDDALHWSTPQNPWRPAWYMRELFVRCKLRHRLRWFSCLRGPFYRFRGTTLPAVSVFIFDPVATVATAPHSGDRYYSFLPHSQGRWT